MNRFTLKNYVYTAVIAGIAIITAVWAFETYESSYSVDEVVTVLTLMILGLASILALGFSFSALIRLPQDKQDRKTPNKYILWLFLFTETAIFFTASYLLNSLTLFLMPVIFLVLALYPIARYTTFLSQFIFGLGFASLPLYIWAAVWGKFYTISNEFTFQPFILGIVIWLWITVINIRHSITTDVSSKYERTIFSVFGLSASRLAINLSISIIIGLLLFLTVIHSHTFVMWIGLSVTVFMFLWISSRLQRSNEHTGCKVFDKMSLLAISAFTVFQTADVIIDVLFLPY